MLKFPVCFSKNEKVNTMIKRYMNERISDMMKDEMLIYNECGYDAIVETDKEFAYEISWHFPENYPEDKIVGKYLGLYALLISEEEFVPELVMEYVIDSLLKTQVALWKDSGQIWSEPVPEREYVLSALREEFGDITDTENGIRSAEDILQNYENLCEYRDYYFWDTDFAFLDILTEEEIQKLDMNRQLGIVDINKKDNRFVIPKEWIK